MTPVKLTPLLTIAFIQYVMRYIVLLPIIREQGVYFQLSDFNFFCLVISTICIAAAGLIKEQKNTGTHIILSIAGILLGCYVIMKAGAPNLILTYIALAIMLLLYLFVYKHHFLVGNIIVALFFASVPMIVLLDIVPIYSAYGRLLLEMNVTFNYAIYWFSGVSLFIFLTVISCEIIKDTEDFENDLVTCDSRTFPFIMGAPYTKWTIIALNTAIIVMLILMYVFFLRNIAAWLSFFYITLLMIVPIVFVNWKVHKALVGDDYRRTCNTMKLIIVAGLAYSAVLWL